MTQLMRTMAVVPPAAPPVATVDGLAALMGRLHASSLADQAAVVMRWRRLVSLGALLMTGRRLPRRCASKSAS